MFTVTKERALAIRERYGWTQEDIADRLNVTAQTIKNYEHGRRAIDGPAAVLYEWFDAVGDMGTELTKAIAESKATCIKSSGRQKQPKISKTGKRTVPSSRWDFDKEYNLIDLANMEKVIISGEEADMIDIKYVLEDEEIDGDLDISIDDYEYFSEVHKYVKKIRLK